MSDSTTAENAMLTVSVAEGKYTVVQDAEGRLTALRYGEPWRDCCGDGLIHALASEVENLREKLADATKAIVDSSAAGTTKAGKIRLSLDLTPAAKDKLEELVRKSGATTMIEAVRKMFALYEMVIDLQKAGGKVVLESSAGLREVLRLL